MARKQDLERWRDAGLIDEATVRSIEAFEKDADETPRWLEAIAYIGAALLLAGSISVMVRIWDDMGSGTVLFLIAIATAISFAAGWMFGRTNTAVARRAQAATWFLGTAGFLICVGMFVFEVNDLDQEIGYTILSLSTFAVAFTLWRLRPSSLQMVAVAIGAGASVVVPLVYWEKVPEWLFGATLAALGVAWIIGTYRRALHPTRTSYAMGAIGVLLIGFPDAIGVVQLLAGTVACVGLIAAGAKLNENALLGLGVAGLLWYPPALAGEVFGDGIGFTLALLGVGAILLLIVAARLRANKPKASG